MIMNAPHYYTRQEIEDGLQNLTKSIFMLLANTEEALSHQVQVTAINITRQDGRIVDVDVQTSKHGNVLCLKDQIGKPVLVH